MAQSCISSENAHARLPLSFERAERRVHDLSSPVQAPPIGILNSVLLAGIDACQRLGQVLEVEHMRGTQREAGLAQQHKALVCQGPQGRPEQDALPFHLRACLTMRFNSTEMDSASSLVVPPNPIVYLKVSTPALQLPMTSDGQPDLHCLSEMPIRI